MLRGRRTAVRAALATASGVVVLVAAGCSGSSSSDDPTAASSSVAAALSSAAQASPGEYGNPVDPAMPNPTSVATDAPVSTATGAAVSVVVTYSDWASDTSSIEVGAFVQGVVENGGTCTLRLTGRTGTVTTTTTAEADADTTSCATLTVPGTELASGAYTGEVTYRSDDADGVSATVTVVVP